MFKKLFFFPWILIGMAAFKPVFLKIALTKLFYLSAELIITFDRRQAVK